MMINTAKSDSIFKNREILLNAIQQEAKGLKDAQAPNYKNTNQTLKLFARMHLSKKDITFVDNKDLKKLLHTKYEEQKAINDEETEVYSEAMEQLQGLRKVQTDDADTDFNSDGRSKRGSGAKRRANRHHENSSLAAEGQFGSVQNVTWQKWSGNTSEVPAELRRFLPPQEDFDDDEKDEGRGGGDEVISILFKSPLWQQITKSGLQQSSAVSSSSHAHHHSVHFNDDHNQNNATGSSHQADRDDSGMEVSAVKRHCPANRRYNSMGVVDFLASIPALQYLKIVTLRYLENLVQRETYSRNQVIMTHGQNIANVYVIRKGVVKMSRPNPLSPFQSDEVQTQYSGELFGYDLNIDQQHQRAGRYNTSDSMDDGSTAPSVHCSRYTYTAGSDNTEVLVFPLTAFLTALQQDRQFTTSLPCNMALHNQSNAYPYSLEYLTLHSYIELYRDLWHMLPATVPPTSTGPHSNNYSGNSLAQHAEALEKIQFLCSPELDFVEVVDELLVRCKALLGADRMSVYVVDKLLNTMVLFTSQQAAANGNNNGIRMPLKGLAAHVAQHNSMLNIPDCYANKLFDPSMDIRTGYRTTQMLCCPVRDDARNSSSNVIAVLQCINSKDKVPFTQCHELLATMVCSLLGTKHYLVKQRSSMNIYKSVLKLRDQVKFTLNRVVTDKPHRHVKLTVRLLMGSGNNAKQVGKTFHSELLETAPLSDTLRQCEADCEVDFGEVYYHQLPLTSKIIIQLYSRNNHPAGWCGVDVFQFDRVLRTNDHELRLWDGAYPNPSPVESAIGVHYVPSCLQGFESLQASFDGEVLSRSSTTSNTASSVNIGAYNANDTLENLSTISVRMASSDVNVLFEATVETPLRFVFPEAERGLVSTAAPLLPGVQAMEWYLRHMSDSERRKLKSWQEIYEVVSAVSIDQDSAELLWRVRHPASKENPSSLVLSLLCVDYSNPVMAGEAYKLLSTCAAPSFLDALQLLDSRFTDYKVRNFAVSVLSSISDEQLACILYPLVYNLRYESYLDNALARFLLQRALRSPYGIGQQLLWLLNNNFEQDPIYCNQCNVLATLLLRVLTDEQRMHISQGMFMLRLIHNSYNQVRSHSSLSAFNTTGKNKVAEAQSRSKAALNLLAQEVSSFVTNLPSEFVLPLPLILPQQSGEAEESDQESTQPVCSGIVNWYTGEEKLQSFSFSLKTLAHEKQFLMYSQDADHRIETLYQQLMHTVDLIWSTDTTSPQIRSLRCVTYRSLSIVDDKNANNASHSPAMLIEQPANAQTLQSLIVAALHAEFLAAKEDTTKKRGRKPDTGPKKIPEGLVETYLQQSKEGGPPLDGLAYSHVRTHFLKSLAAYLVASHVLGVEGISVANTALTKRGDLYVVTPPYLLAFEHRQLTRRHRSGDKIVSAPRFYLPCFAKLLGPDNSVERREFDGLISGAFLSLRRNVSSLVYSVTTLSRQLNMPEELIKSSISMIRDNLFLHMSDPNSLLMVNDAFNKGLRADYQLNINFN